MKYSRDQEREADQLAIEKLQRVDISSDGIKNFFERLHEEYEWMDRLSWVSSHPINTERIQRFNTAFQSETATLPSCIHKDTYMDMRSACRVSAPE